MCLTRYPARSSFTFEIKRASRPKPDILNCRKTPLFAGPSLADQVFGKFSGPSNGPYLDGSPPPALGAGLGLLRLNSRENDTKTEPTRHPSPRRILPDLLSAPPNPVEERLRAEAEERAARRRAARRMRVDEGQGTSPKPIHDIAVKSDALNDPIGISAENQTLTGEALAAPQESATAHGLTTVSRPRRSSNPKAAARRAQKKGLPAPRLPAGERWKARLSWTCW